MARRSLFSVVMWMCSLLAVAQTDSLFTLSGRVVDAKTHRPMPYVSVTYREVGTVTNEEGEFTLKLKSRPDRVSFSCLGYQSRRLPLAELEGQRVISLSPSSVVLSEVIVNGGDARELVMQAVDKIERNYPRVPNLLRGFYRETVQKRRRFFSISEGVVDLYKSAYDRSNWRDGVAILKGRRLLSQRPGDTLAVKLQGGPVLPIELDVVKQRDIIFSPEELSHYSFRFLQPRLADQRMQYVVEMTPLVQVDYPLYRGLLYIDQQSLAFTRVDIQLDMSSPAKVTQAILRKKPAGLRFTPHELSLYIDYQTVDGVTRINYVRNVIRFRCDWKRRLFKSNFTVTSEMVVTNRREGTDLRPIRVRDTFNRKDNFYDRVVYFDDPDFWGSENIIEPTEYLLQGIEKIKQKLKN